MQIVDQCQVPLCRVLGTVCSSAFGAAPRFSPFAGGPSLPIICPLPHFDARQLLVLQPCTCKPTFTFAGTQSLALFCAAEASRQASQQGSGLKAHVLILAPALRLQMRCGGRRRRKTRTRCTVALAVAAAAGRPPARCMRPCPACTPATCAGEPMKKCLSFAVRLGCASMSCMPLMSMATLLGTLHAPLPGMHTGHLRG